MTQLDRAHSDHPPFRYPDYKSTMKRSPDKDMVRILRTLTENTGPGQAVAQLAMTQMSGQLSMGQWSVEDTDLTTNAGTGQPAIGERIIVTGRVLDENGQALSGTLLEIWQTNASGRYAHWRESDFPAPLDPNFLGVGQCLTDEEGVYRFTSIKPGPYPWGNHPNAWRPAHIHFSLMGPTLGSRLVTQMYFENDPLLPLDPIFNSAPEHSRGRMIAKYDHGVTVENWALGWRWDIVVEGSLATPTDPNPPGSD